MTTRFLGIPPPALDRAGVRTPRQGMLPTMEEELKARTETTYNAAASHFDAPALTFWDAYGRATVAHLGAGPGWRILDVCCGTGSSAIPAAEAVGPSGRVVGVDLAEQLLALARAKAAARELSWVSFQRGDMEALPFETGSFDAVVCVFGVFFVPDMEAAAREMMRVVRPGGRLAITTWGPEVLEPGTRMFWDAVAAVRADLHQTYMPWMRVSTPEQLRALLDAAGAIDVTIEAATVITPLRAPEEWWDMVLGTGYRGTTDQLVAEEYEDVRRRNLEAVRAAGMDAVRGDALYAVGVKP